MMRRFLPALIALAGLTTLATAGTPNADTHWLHVKVDQKGPEAETVRINLPIRLVAEVLPMIKDGRFHGGYLHLDSLGTHGDMDFRGMLAALKDAPDGEYVTVDSPDEKVRINKEKGLLLIKVRNTGPEPEAVDVKVRMDILEALLSGPPGQLNVSAAVAVLGSDEAELVTVHEEDETVRIWVDGKATAD
jgi:hypothetical protein